MSIRVAPVPFASTVTMRSITSSTPSVPAMFSANRESTSYGVARSPYTRRFARRWACPRSGWKSSAIKTAAVVVRTDLLL